MKRINAYLTVYLSLTMTVLLSLFLALFEGVRSNAIRLEAECIMDIGMDSILAEYHRELFEQYNLFAIDSSYGGDTTGKENVSAHLRHYVERNMSLEDIFLESLLYRDFLTMKPEGADVTRVSVITDEKGAVFRRKVVEAIEHDTGLTLFTELLNWLEVVETNQLTETDVAQRKKQVDEAIEAYNGMEVEVAENRFVTIQIDNPTAELEKDRRRGALSCVVKDMESVSEKSIFQESLIGSRMAFGEVNQGSLPVGESTGGEKLWERFLFQEYLMNYMGHYGSEKEDKALDYEIEYLLSGMDNDISNLSGVVDVLTGIREAANALYIFRDKEKCAEAEIVAWVICGILEIPELADLLKASLLLAWSFAESLHDVEVLLEGGKVPLMKTADTWYYSLANALTGFQFVADAKNTEGLSYEDYLRILLMLEKEDVLTARAMNLVEANIRLTPGNQDFRLDGCYVKVEASMQVSSQYGYHYELTRQKEYY